MKRQPLLHASIIAMCMTTGAVAQTVSRDIADPNANVWKESDWVSATGSWQGVDERAPEASANGKTLRVSVNYPAKTFAHWGLTPGTKALPGRVEKITAWTRRVQKSGGGELTLKGADGKERKFGLSANTPEWKFVEIKIPADMPQPLSLESFSIHNWGDKDNPKASTIVFDICDLRVHTDVSEIAPEARPFSADVAVNAPANIFYAGEKPTATLAFGSWIGDERTLSFDAKVVSSDGATKPLDIPNLTCADAASCDVALPFAAPGAYTIELEVKGFPAPVKKSVRYVVCLEPPALTEAQKERSPYGINVHGGTFVGYERFARLGFVWLRDYAFTFDWMTRARGEGAYAGWPWYPKIIGAAEANGLKTLPCLMHALAWDPKNPDSPVTPTDEWRRQMALIVATFPNLNCWELDNEVEFKMSNESEAYANYHRVFADIVKTVAPNALAVEQGAAGIHTEATRRHVLSGAFKDIDVVNGHRYCGVSAPEISKSNANTGQGEAKQTFLRDVFREWKRAACADGKDRQMWLTEFGWDTRAGQIVTEWEQAAYLQRGYMLCMANGVDKVFWYWYYDSDTDTPQHFFDGCGIFDRFREPKPVAAAFGAMRTFLPTDMKYVGYANLSPNAMAQIFEVDGKYVAAAFKIDIAGADFTISNPNAEAVYDMYGAPVDASKKRKLDVAPTWYIGLDKNCDWLKQTPMDVDSNHFVRNVAGEAIRVVTTKVGDYSVRAPKGWTVEKTDEGFDVTAPKGTPRGSAELFVAGKNHGAEKVMKLDVDIVPEAYAKSYAVGFDGTFTVDVVNQSESKKTHTIVASVPNNWKVEPAQQSVTLDHEEKGTLTFTLAKSAPISAKETEHTPKLLVKNEADMVIDAVPVVPREWTMKKVANIALDGNLADWTVDHQMPAWMLGPRGDKEASRVYMGYAADGVYLAFDMADSKAWASDPRSFWRAADCVEFMFNPVGDFTEGRAWSRNDHQFWFCPLPDENRAFAGFWGRTEGQEIAYDIADIKSSVTKNATGYTMELFIPASRLHGYNPQKGTRAALSFSIAVQGHRDQREVFWPASKADNMIAAPWMWGRILFD